MNLDGATLCGVLTSLSPRGHEWGERAENPLVTRFAVPEYVAGESYLFMSQGGRCTLEPRTLHSLDSAERCLLDCVSPCTERCSPPMI